MNVPTAEELLRMYNEAPPHLRMSGRWVMDRKVWRMLKDLDGRYIAPPDGEPSLWGRPVYLEAGAETRFEPAADGLPPIQIEDVKRLYVKAGDVLLVTVPAHTTNHVAEYIKEQFEKHLPDVKVIIMTTGIAVGVVSQEVGA